MQDRPLLNVALRHHVGYTTNEAALRRLPLQRATIAIVMADVNEDDTSAYGGAELQIADSEAFTSALLLRKLHSQARDRRVAWRASIE